MKVKRAEHELTPIHELAPTPELALAALLTLPIDLAIFRDLSDAVIASCDGTCVGRETIRILKLLTKGAEARIEITLSSGLDLDLQIVEGLAHHASIRRTLNDRLGSGFVVFPNPNVLLDIRLRSAPISTGLDRRDCRRNDYKYTDRQALTFNHRDTPKVIIGTTGPSGNVSFVTCWATVTLVCFFRETEPTGISAAALLQGSLYIPLVSPSPAQAHRTPHGADE